ncbi:hypothetical protein BLNAU_10222 [Blattamonas nauphoetae]|uniref:Uncharacterized protein n=1 Tax=Blattamonas nauphoetae TaxID=2049346 RepID=A0ABQ9XLL4_9EUKA|nr:hypothetical protein BLNAU_13544 [Blattamonas nauphoetae]KAK2954892.1 hypothetical protein BLNAU_10222 [Blattamonas nauphoetae]
MVNQTIAQILSVFRNRLPTYAILSQSQKKQTPIDSSLRFAFRRNQTYLSNLVVFDTFLSTFSDMTIVSRHSVPVFASNQLLKSTISFARINSGRYVTKNKNKVE